MLSFLGL